MYHDRLETDLMENSYVEKDLVVLVGNRLAISQSASRESASRMEPDPPQSLPSYRMRDYGRKLKQRKFYLNVRKNFMMREMKNCNKLCRKVCTVFSGDNQSLPGCFPVHCSLGQAF